MPLFDTHAHYNDDAFDQDRKGLLDALPDAGVGAVVIPGVDVESSRSALALAENRPWLFAAAGIHPGGLRRLHGRGFFRHPGPVPGEKSGRHRRDRLGLLLGGESAKGIPADGVPPPAGAGAGAWSCRVIVHDREAHGDSLEIVKEFPGVRGVFHCFSGSPEMAEELLKRGWYLGFDGPVTYKNARRAPEVVAVTPWTGSWWRRTRPT